MWTGFCLPLNSTLFGYFSFLPSPGRVDEIERGSDVSGFTDQMLLAIEDWRDLFMFQYKYAGKLLGPFYDQSGS